MAGEADRVSIEEISYTEDEIQVSLLVLVIAKRNILSAPL